jgi:hypothetical protein
MRFETQITAEMSMRTAWPWLWALMTARSQVLGYEPPIVMVGKSRLQLNGFVGSGAQGVCYAAEMLQANGPALPVVVKISERHEELYRERRVLGALRTLTQLDGPLNASMGDGGGSSDGGGGGSGGGGGDGGGGAAKSPRKRRAHKQHAPSWAAPKDAHLSAAADAGLALCDGQLALDAAAQRCLPRVVAYGPGVLVMTPLGAPFHEGAHFPARVRATGCRLAINP